MEIENLADDVSIELIDNKIQVTIISASDEVSIHLWHISGVNSKNKSRIYISGWTKLKQFVLDIDKSGDYYVHLFNKKNGKGKLSNVITVHESDLFANRSSESIDQYLDDKGHKIESNEQLMQRMFIAGGEEIIYQLKQVVGSRKISIFAQDYASARIANMLFAQEFFDGRLKIENFLTFDRINMGYFISATYRKNYDPLDIYMDKLSSNDALIVINLDDIADKSKINLLKNRGVKIIDFSKVVYHSVINKVLVRPLQQVKESGNQVVYVRFPQSNKIKNKSDLEQIAAKTSIGKIRSEIKNGEYPAGLTSLDVSVDYMKQVIAGWKLVPQDAAYDLLEDKQEEFVNIQGGHRIIPADQNQKSERTIYLFGNSVMYGIGSDDRHTLPSLLAGLLKNNEFHYYVKNMANFSMNDYVRGTNLMKSIHFQKEDIIIFGSHESMSEDQQHIFGGEYIDMTKYFDRPHSMGEVFLDMTHLNKNGYNKMAVELYNNLLEKGLIVH